MIKQVEKINFSPIVVLESDESSIYKNGHLI